MPCHNSRDTRDKFDTTLTFELSDLLTLESSQHSAPEPDSCPSNKPRNLDHMLKLYSQNICIRFYSGITFQPQCSAIRLNKWEEDKIFKIAKIFPRQSRKSWGADLNNGPVISLLALPFVAHTYVGILEESILLTFWYFKVRDGILSLLKTDIYIYLLDLNSKVKTQIFQQFNKNVRLRFHKWKLNVLLIGFFKMKN